MSNKSNESSAEAELAAKSTSSSSVTSTNTIDLTNEEEEQNENFNDLIQNQHTNDVYKTWYDGYRDLLESRIQWTDHNSLDSVLVNRQQTEMAHYCDLIRAELRQQSKKWIGHESKLDNLCNNLLAARTYTAVASAVKADKMADIDKLFKANADMEYTIICIDALAVIMRMLDDVKGIGSSQRCVKFVSNTYKGNTNVCWLWLLSVNQPARKMNLSTASSRDNGYYVDVPKALTSCLRLKRPVKSKEPSELHKEEVSHLCHTHLCVNPKHILAETCPMNKARNYCAGPPHCYHNPLCILPYVNSRDNPLKFIKQVLQSYTPEKNKRLMFDKTTNEPLKKKQNVLGDITNTISSF